FRRRNLPHWRVAARPYFVTIRLKNSIPRNRLIEIKGLSEKIKSDDNNEVILDIQRKQFIKMEQILDSQQDNRFLENPEIAEMIIAAYMMVEARTMWRIATAVVMPNHLHLLMVGEKANCTLDDCLKLLKGYTGRKANQILGGNGAFWCSEYFDHWCRTPEKVENSQKYIINNPVKAGLVNKAEDYRWIYRNIAASVEPRK
ncbi:MAG: transposase, partial [Victivallales bacterium]